MASPFARLTVHKNSIEDSGGTLPGGQSLQILIDISADSSLTVVTYLRCLELFNREFEKGLHAAKAEMVEEISEVQVLSPPVCGKSLGLRHASRKRDEVCEASTLPRFLHNMHARGSR